jgi:AraC-like DNA-binding protein
MPSRRHDGTLIAGGGTDASQIATRSERLGMNRPAVPLTRHLLRVRDLIDRAYSQPLDVKALARSAAVSPAYFSRSFKAAFGETPHQYLVSRRIERAKALLRAGELSVTDICFAVGFASLGSFSTQFRHLVGDSPMAYRRRTGHADLARVPSCYVRTWTRPLPLAARLGSFREVVTDARA